MSSLSIGQRVARTLWRAAPTRSYSGLVGWGARQPIPPFLRNAVLGGFAKQVGANVDEAEKSLGEYGTLNEFFTRSLKSGLRPVDPDPKALVHPADGKLVVVADADADARVNVKGFTFSIPQLLGGGDLAEPFAGGPFAITYLSPKDYHRVHTPAEGEVTAWAHIPGTLFPVNEASTGREPGLFAENERLVTFMEGPIGRFVVIMVAAVGVGHITVSYDPEVGTHAEMEADGAVRLKRFEKGNRPRLERGAELGIFHLGSTAIILFERGRAQLDSADVGKAVRVATRIGNIS